jgi:hypothetical protein
MSPEIRKKDRLTTPTRICNLFKIKEQLSF